MTKKEVKIVAVVIGLGVIVGDGVCVTHDVELTDEKLIDDIQKLVDKYYNFEELFKKRKKRKF